MGETFESIDLSYESQTIFFGVAWMQLFITDNLGCLWSIRYSPLIKDSITDFLRHLFESLFSVSILIVGVIIGAAFVHRDDSCFHRMAISLLELRQKK